MIITPLVLVVSPKKGKPGVYRAKIEGCGLLLRDTKHPMVDCARGLLLVGVDPGTTLIMRTEGSDVDRLRSQIGTIVRKVSRKGRLAHIKRFNEPQQGQRGSPVAREKQKEGGS